MKIGLTRCFLIIVCLGVGLYSQENIAMNDDEQMAIKALESLQKINSQDLTSLPDFKEILNNQYGDASQPYFPSGTPMDLVNDGKTKATLGKELSKGLTKQARNLEDQATKINEQQIMASSKDSNQDLTPVEIVNKTLLDLETIPNARNPMTEAAFVALEQNGDQLQQELGLGTLPQTIVRPEYVATKQTTINAENYEMGCSTTLLSPTFTCTKSLTIAIEEQPDVDFNKRIAVSFQSHTYNLSSVSVDFRQGTVTLWQGRGDVKKSFSDLLDPEFDANTKVTLIAHQPNAEGGTSNTIVRHPCFDNGFIASYTNFQPKTGHKYKHNRNRYRGANLIYDFKTTKRQPPKITNEIWQGDCGELEDLTTLQECRLAEEVCVAGEETRRFGNQEPYLYVNRPCWKKRFTYHCNIPQGDNDCDSIPSNCIKTGSEFKEFLGQKAVEIHHFTCSKNNQFTVENITNNGFKEVDNVEYEKNNDFGTAVASLSLIKEITKDVRQEGYGNNGKFFNGQAMHCTCKPKNCCADKKGFWRKMTGCKNEEIQLAEHIKNGTCHLIDSYRIKNSVLQKIGHVEKQGYCCYQSKLSRVIQEGAKPQLDHSWGSGEMPQCEALTVNDLERIDWSQINFSEIANDFIKKAQNANASSALITAVSNNLNQTTNKIQEDYQNKLPETNLRKEQNQYLQEISKKIAQETARRKLHKAKNKKQAEAQDEKK